MDFFNKVLKPYVEETKINKGFNFSKIIYFCHYDQLSLKINQFVARPCHVIFFLFVCFYICQNQMIFQISSLRAVISKRSQEREKIRRLPILRSQTRRNQGGKTHLHCTSPPSSQVTDKEVVLHSCKGESLAARSHWY